jgi:hypothetical protein
MHFVKSICLLALATLMPIKAADAQQAPTQKPPIAVKGGETVSIGGVNNILIRHPAARGSIILLTGGDGMLKVTSDGRFSAGETNVLIRNRDAFAAPGFNVLLVDKGTNLAAAIEAMATLKRPVAVVATSSGTLRAAEGLVKGAKPDRLVFTSGLLTEASGSPKNVAGILKNPALLPRTLVVHHRDDGCRLSKPAGAKAFVAWAGKPAELVWISGGVTEGNPCKASAHHGFYGQDTELVSVIVRFLQ